MWVKLFRAEFYKIIGNRWATGCMIWIFPFMAVLLTCFLLFLSIFSGPRHSMAQEPTQWTDAMMIAWVIPNNPFGQILLLGFTAVFFAGEYQWNTWKSIVPRSWRVPLIVIKFITVGIFIVLAFVIMSILLGIGFGLVSVAIGANYGPALSGEVLTDFIDTYLKQALTTFLGTLLAGSYAALAAMMTRSILGSVLIGFLIMFIQTLLALPLALLAWLLSFPDILHIYRFTPFYSLTNLTGWLFENSPVGMEINGTTYNDSAEFSLVLLICWVVGLVGLTAYLFQRQDITN